MKKEKHTSPKLQPAEKTDQVWQSRLHSHIFMKAEEQCLLQYHDCSAVFGAMPASTTPLLHLYFISAPAPPPPSPAG